MIRALLYDLDGLIIDTEPIHFRAFRQFMRAHGVELPETVMPRLIGFNEIDNIRVLREEYGLRQPLEELISERRAIYARLLETEEIPVFPGFWELAEQARRRGLKQAVVSSSLRPQVEGPLRRLLAQREGEQDPLRFFDAIVSGDEVAQPKPAPDIYVLARERLGLPGEECLAFEDTPVGAASAAAAGIPVYAVPNQYTHHLPFPGAKAVLDSLCDALALLNERPPG